MLLGAWERGRGETAGATNNGTFRIGVLRVLRVSPVVRAKHIPHSGKTWHARDESER